MLSKKCRECGTLLNGMDRNQLAEYILLMGRPSEESEGDVNGCSISLMEI